MDQELSRAVKRMERRQTVPDPDGIPGRVLPMTVNILHSSIGRLFDIYLANGKFSEIWKTATLILIPKPKKKDLEAPSSCRPICLINEIGKMLEKVVTDRVWEHLNLEGPNISDDQYDFRVGRSRLSTGRYSWLVRRCPGGGVALPVSLDIVNAFDELLPVDENKKRVGSTQATGVSADNHWRLSGQ